MSFTSGLVGHLAVLCIFAQWPSHVHSELQPYVDPSTLPHTLYQGLDLSHQQQPQIVTTGEGVTEGINKPITRQQPVMVRPFMGPLVPIPLERHPHARCLDGTSGGYYFLPGDPKMWIIHMNGGGGCINLLSCRMKTFTPLGSSKNWPLFHSFRMPGTLQNTDEIANHHFASATMVLVPYCSADLWSGHTTQPNQDSFNFWFSGHHIIDAVIQELMMKRGMKEADLVVLTGGADGGVGTVLHLDHIADRMAKEGMKARLVGVPMGGFTGLVNLHVQPYTGPASTPYVRSDAAVLPTYTHMWSSVGPKECAKQQKPSEEWKCILPAFVIPTLKTPVFFVQAQTDSVHLPKYYGVPPGKVMLDQPQSREWLTNYVALYKEEMKLLMSYYTKRNTVGFFSPACWTHTYFDNMHLNGMTYQDALVDFLQKPKRTLIMDNCGLFCNPDCQRPDQWSAFNGPQMP